MINLNDKIQLRYKTPKEWAQKVLEDFDTFLNDHAAAEKKASGMAMSMALHYRHKERLVEEMIDLSIEELQHFKACVKLIHSKGLSLLPDEKDAYVNKLRSYQRQGQEVGLLDRLLVAGIVESRGCERFGLVADALPEGDMKNFYQAITASEDKHQTLFVDLAKEYFSEDVIRNRLDELLDLEATLVESLPLKATLH